MLFYAMQGFCLMNYHKCNPSTCLKNKLQSPITNSSCDSYVGLRISDDPKISEQLPSLTHTFLTRPTRTLFHMKFPHKVSLLYPFSDIHHFLFSTFPLTFFLSPFIPLRTNKIPTKQQTYNQSPWDFIFPLPH